MWRVAVAMRLPLETAAWAGGALSMADTHAFCTVHRIAYNRALDPVCPQCTLARIVPAQQLVFDTNLQKPLDAARTPLDPFTLEAAK